MFVHIVAQDGSPRDEQEPWLEKCRDANVEVEKTHLDAVSSLFDNDMNNIIGPYPSTRYEHYRTRPKSSTSLI